jgi:hypothetical protein
MSAAVPRPRTPLTARSTAVRAPVGIKFDKVLLDRCADRDDWKTAFDQLEPLEQLVKEGRVLVGMESPSVEATLYVSELVRSILNQCDSARSAVVKKACETLQVVVLAHAREVNGACYQDMVKYVKRGECCCLSVGIAVV